MDRLANNFASTKSKLKGKSAMLARAIEYGEVSHKEGASIGVPYALSIRESEVATGQKGVFAKKRFKRNQAIIMAIGKFVEVDAGYPKEVQKYIFDMTEDYNGYGLCCYHDIDTNLVKYINSSHKTKKQNNVVLLWHGCLGMIYALQDISKGEELLLDYKWKK